MVYSTHTCTAKTDEWTKWTLKFNFYEKKHTICVCKKSIKN